MGYSKRQFISAAFEEIGLASYVFDLQPEQLQSAMRRLDAMMADWNGKGIRLGYPLPSAPKTAIWTSKPTYPTGPMRPSSPTWLFAGSGYGKVVMPETKATGKGQLQHPAATRHHAARATTARHHASWRRQQALARLRQPVHQTALQPSGRWP
jgi:hypothetical protein